jgi:hypothetical protein
MANDVTSPAGVRRRLIYLCGPAATMPAISRATPRWTLRCLPSMTSLKNHPPKTSSPDRTAIMMSRMVERNQQHCRKPNCDCQQYK